MEAFMSTAAQSPAAPPAAQAAGFSGYSLARAQGKCSLCGRDIAPGEKFTAAVRESAAGLERLDITPECWEQLDKKTLLAYWQGTMPTTAAARPKLFVDDAVLCDLFERLADAAEPAKLNFRFVLALILMRKRLIVYESTHLERDQEFWTLRMKGREQLLDLINPKLDEAQIAEVTAQLGQILSGEPA
jgi:hypothetical protein